MPIKKKSTVLKDTSKTTEKKFVVEEKPHVEESKSPEIAIKPADTPAVLTETESKPEISVTDADTKIDLPSSDKEDKPKSDLANANEKDTIPASGITSFSLLDSKEKDNTKESTMDDTSKTIEQPAQTTADTSQEPVKTSQEEVNKWIENYDEKEVPEKKKGAGFFRIFLIFLIILSLGAVIAGGVYYYQKNIAGDKTVVIEQEPGPAEEIEEPVVEPTAVPEKEEVDYTELTLQILNGSGIPGEAGAVKDLITDFEFDNIVTGNASSYDYEKTVISFKEDVPKQVYTDIAEAISDTYEVEEESETLEDSSDYDVIITVGAKK